MRRGTTIAIIVLLLLVVGAATLQLAISAGR